LLHQIGDLFELNVKQRCQNVKEFRLFTSELTVNTLKNVSAIMLHVETTLHVGVSTHLQRGHAVMQLVEALRYKPEGPGFDFRWFNWNFLLIRSIRPHCGPGVDSASNGNEYQEYILGGKGGRCVGLTNLPTSCADCPEIWEPHPPVTLWACPNL
jgi:hypothetical protein